MSDMFCFQCQQTAGNTGCVRTGVCGKQPETAGLQDDLIYELIRLASAAHIKNIRSKEKDRLLHRRIIIQLLTNVNFDNEAIRAFIQRVKEESDSIGGGCDLIDLWEGETDIVSLRSTLLFGLQRHGRLRSPCHESGL